MSTYTEIQKTMFTCKAGQRVKFKKNGVHVGCEIFSTDGKSMLIGFYPKGGAKIVSTIKNVLGCIEDAELWVPDPLLQQKSAVYIPYEAELTEEAAKTFNDILCSANDKLECENGYTSKCELMESSSGNSNRIACQTHHIQYSLVGTNCRSFLVAMFGEGLQSAIALIPRFGTKLKL
jgi:hypothetical protein